MISKADMVDFFEGSATTYQFLSQAMFKELNDDAIAALAAGEWPENTGNAKLDSGYAMMRRYFAFAASDARTQLACEYARVFLAAGVYTKKRRTAVPYESVFTSEEHIVMQDSRDDVLARYLEDGFQVNPELHEPEDHLAFELEYLSTMSERAAKLAEAGDGRGLARNVQRQIDFIDKHLLNWVGDLRDVAKEYAKLTFYMGMLLVIEGTLEESRAVLVEVLDGLGESACDAGGVEHDTVACASSGEAGFAAGVAADSSCAACACAC